MSVPRESGSPTSHTAPGAAAGSMRASTAQLREQVRARLTGQSGINKKAVDQRCALVAAIAHHEGAAVDVTGIYRALLDMGEPLSMPQIYRGLHALASDGLLVAHWLLEDGRPRRGYTLPHGGH
ncbi:hypothetical protein DBA29_26465 [Xenophilus aerolatus]|nr:hypothetical protein [Xenophilus aerolatus]